MKSHHSGIAGRTANHQRHIDKHIANGLCMFCSNKAVIGKRLCKYHREYYNLAGQKHRKKIMGANAPNNETLSKGEHK